jgi:Amt family ammonium transporter
VTSSIVVLSETASALCILCIFLVPFACAGLALMNTGLGRSRSSAHSMTASLCVLAAAALTYFVCGFSWQGFVGLPQHSFMVHGKAWGWIAQSPFFLRGLEFNGSSASLSTLLQVVSVGFAALIPLGAGTDRWRLSAACVSTVLFAGWTYPLFAHWVWGGGWLAQLGQNYALGGGFIDAGGSSSIHAVGGLTALSIAWILGPRRGKYSSNGMPTAIPGHNSVIVLFGCLLLWIGFLGLNSAGAILFAGVETGHIVLVGLNTTLSAGAAALAAAILTRVRFGKSDASITANAWVGGLVASSAGCALLNPAAAAVVGMIGGALVTLAVEKFEFTLKVDDPAGSISVHALGGIWGVLAVGIFAGVSDRPAGQFLAQLVGIATLIGFVLPLTYGLNWFLDRVLRQRVALAGERQGVDLYELGADAYPEFVTHSEEFLPR